MAALRVAAASADDVARLAGVSQSAVSRAFTPGASISPAMRQRVEDAASVLGYQPNQLARSLITRRSGLIGIAIGYLDNPFYPAVLEALSRRLAAAGCRPLLLATDTAGEPDVEVRELLRYRIDGLILASTTLSSRLAEDCRRAGVPVLLFNRTTDDPAASSVTGDNVAGAAAIADLFAATGHRRPAFLAGLEESSTSSQREAGFGDRLATLGLAAPIRAVGHYASAPARAAVRDLLARADPPDALFCANDHMAFAAIEVARADFGLTVGRDISIAGFDDTPMAAWSSFDLTSYAQPVEPMVARAVEGMLRLRDNPGLGFHEAVPGHLALRSSVRPARPPALYLNETQEIDMGRLDGKIAIVTGIGSGIGQGIARRFAAEGARVMGCDIDAAAAERTLVDSAGTIESLHPVDLTLPDDVDRLIAHTVDRFGGIDILVNAAAMGHFVPIETMDYEAHWKATLTGELDLVFLACKAAWPYLKKSGGAIVNFASANAWIALEGSFALAHCAGKGGVLAMTRQLALEGGPHNIRANTISPGLVVTTATSIPLQDEGFRRHVTRLTMLKRLGQPEDIAACAAFLASDDATWVTAADFRVDGGATHM